MLIKKLNELFKDTNIQMISLVFIVPILFILLGEYATDHNAAFYKVTPHPYLVACIILSAYLGLQFSLILAPILSLQYLILLHYQTDYQAVETIITIEYLSLPLSFIILSAIVGEFKTRSVNKIILLKKDNQDKEELTESLIDKVNLITKESYEIKKQLVNKLDTTASIFTQVKGLNVINKDELFNNFLDIIHNQLSIQCASIYLINAKQDSLHLYKSRLDNSISNIPETYDIQLDIEDEVICKALEIKSLTSMKDVYNDKTLLNNTNAILACPILYNEKLYGLVIIYKMPFLQYTSRNFKIFDLYTQWLANSLSYALEFETMTRNSIFNQSLNIYTYKYIIDRIREEIEVSKRYNTLFTVVSYRIMNTNIRSDSHMAMLRKILASILNQITRKMDYIAEGETSNLFYSLVNMPKISELDDFLKRIKLSIDEVNNNQENNKKLDIEISFMSYSNQNNFDEIKGQMEVYNA